MSEQAIIILAVVAITAAVIVVLATIGSVASMHLRVQIPLFGSADVSFGGEKSSYETVRTLGEIDYAELSDNALFDLLSRVTVADAPEALIKELGRRDSRDGTNRGR